METTRKHWAEVSIALLALLLLVFIRAWRDDHDARIRAEDQTKAAAQILATKDAAIAERDKDAIDYESLLAAQAENLRTPEQAAQVIVKYLPAPAGSAQQQVATVTRADLPPALQAKLPDAPGYTILTNDQAKDIARNELSCDADRHSLTTCTADAADLRAELLAETTTAHAWEAAAKGGTKWQRFGHTLKLVGCAGAGAAVGALTRKGSAAPAIGSAAGVALCAAL